MTPDLAAIRARWEAATKGPWVADFPEIHRVAPSGIPTEVVYMYPNEGGGVVHEADATFIAHAWEDIRALLDRVEALEKGRGE